MARCVGDAFLKIGIIGDIEKKFSQKIINIYDESLEFTCESKHDFSGLIILSKELNFEEKELIYKSEELSAPIIGIQDGFDGLNLFFGGNDSTLTSDSVNQLFLSPGAKLSHIVGGSGWVKGDIKLDKTIFSKDLSDAFFSSMISDKGEILGFEKPGVDWQFGLRFDVFSLDIPRGFENIIKVFLDKCNE